MEIGIMEPAKEKPKRKRPVKLKGRSYAFLRRQGYLVGDVERHVPGHITFDLFGLFDLVGLRNDRPGFSGYQVTDMKHGPEHMEKMLANLNAKTVLLTGNRICLHLWKKMGPRGGMKVWVLTEREMLDDGEKLFFSEGQIIS